MGKKRSKNKHLPRRVYLNHGAYYFVDKHNKWHFLGKTFPDAMQKWANNFSEQRRIVTINDLIDRYMAEISPTKAPKTHECNIYMVKPLRLAFGEMDPQYIKT